MSKLIDLMYNRYFLIFLLICNCIGTIYGYWWYRGQLSDTPWQFIPFVPDSPTATLFLSVFIILLLAGRRWGLMDALAFTTLIKYGVWAVVMNLLTIAETGFISWVALMLIASHGIMSLQAFMFLPHLEIKMSHFLITAAWLFHNDVIDYVYGQYPTYGQLSQYADHIGYFSFWLTVFVLVLLYQIVPRRSN